MDREYTPSEELDWTFGSASFQQSAVFTGDAVSEESVSSAAATTEDPPPPRQKIGIDANRPIDPETGKIEPQVSEPGIIAKTGAGWVRLNFLLGPWTHPNDETLHDGRTWAQTYQRIISGFRNKGVNTYGLLGVEAMPRGPGNRFRSPPPSGDALDDWLEEYAEQVVSILELFSRDMWVIESFNEPDDWHGGNRNWVHPGWFAVILQRLYKAVRRRPEFNHVKLISGPLQGLEINNNAAAFYLQDTYRAGKRMFGWGDNGIPFPFDGVGYHLYVRQGFNPYRRQRERAVQAACHRYLDAIHQVVRHEEGQDKPLYVSEVGWNSKVEKREETRRERFQAHCLQAGLETMVQDPLVDLAVWFCTVDFPTMHGEARYGLYRLGQPTSKGRKMAFQAFRAVCEGSPFEEEIAQTPSNQQILAAFHAAAVELEMGNRWELLAQAGLNLRDLVTERRAPYRGQPVSDLPNLSADVRSLIQQKLEATISHRLVLGSSDALRSGTHTLDAVETLQDNFLHAELDHDISAALQEHIIRELERSNQLLERTFEELAGRERSGGGMPQLLLTVGVVALVISLVVSVSVVLLLSFL